MILVAIRKNGWVLEVYNNEIMWQLALLDYVNEIVEQ